VTVSKPVSIVLRLARPGCTNSAPLTPWPQVTEPAPFVSYLPASVLSAVKIICLHASKDSQFNLPAEVVIAIDVQNPNNSNINAQELVANGNNPQKGALVGQTFMDVNLNETVDKDGISGYGSLYTPPLPLSPTPEN
jgi:hypothetical protein